MYVMSDAFIYFVKLEFNPNKWRQNATLTLQNHCFTDNISGIVYLQETTI